MNWRPATPTDAPALAELATATSAEASVFLQTWYVEIAETAAVAVLPPPAGHHRAHGAWWSRPATDADAIAHLIQLAPAGAQVLQVTVDRSRSSELRAQGFIEAYPLWTMTHDNTTRLSAELPAPLRPAHWRDVSPADFQAAYEASYRDQRVVEPHTPEALRRMTTEKSFADDLSSFAMSPDGTIAGFVLAFTDPTGAIELGPIGTVPRWRGQGVSSALLASTLTHCRNTPTTLTVDAESPTGAHRIYLRHGFQITSRLHAYQLNLPTRP